ncbi:MAG: 18 kDa heat shock protein [Syntrophorhabdus sp. PtaU1.Bin153]|nr:MAG: 18 kDa heat shock protein [Syntrophorhabdus sp. PtaU1.Bin153]
MTDTESKALQAKDKTELATSAEQTRPGRVFTPAVDIFETDKEITLLADMPGVKAENLVVDLHENILTLDGDVQPPEGTDEVDVLREYSTGKYYRQFALSEIIDQPEIKAKLQDGVLRLTLPKVKAATPRRITVNS